MSCTQSYSSYCVLNLSLFCGIAGNVLWSSYRPIRKRSILRKCKSPHNARGGSSSEEYAELDDEVSSVESDSDSDSE